MSPAAGLGLRLALLAGMMAGIFAVRAQPADTRSVRADDRSIQGMSLPSRSMGSASDVDASSLRRVALVIGNSAYWPLTTLRNSANDAEDMCAVLSRLGFETTCLRDLPTRNDFRRAVAQFGARLTGPTTALFYYAGHGVQVNGRNLLLPTTIAPASLADLEAGGVGLDEVFAVMRDARTALNIVILDACRDDPFSGRRQPGIARGLAREEPPPGSVLVYATAPGAVAADGKGRNGLFTSRLLESIGKPGPQIGELLRSVAKRVEQDAQALYGFEQIPYRSFSFSGMFCFSSCDETRIAEQMEALKLQSAAAMRRIRELEAENAALGSAVAQPGVSAGSALQAADRSAEITSLRRQLEELTSRSGDLESYRQRITALEREAREKDQLITEGARREEQRRSRPTGVPTF